MGAEEAKQKEALNGQLKEYIAEWRKTREKEEEELKKLKEKQAKRKEIRAEQEKKLNQAKKEEEEKLRQEGNEKKAKEAEEKKKKLEPQGKKCLRPRRLELEQTKRSLLLVEPVEMPAEKRQRPRNSLKKRRRLPLASD